MLSHADVEPPQPAPAVSVTLDGHAVRAIKDKDAVNWAERAARKKQPSNGLARLYTGDENTSAVSNHKNRDNENNPDVYARNIAKIKVPLHLDPNTTLGDQAYALYNKMDQGAQVFMQLGRANTRMGAAITMITTYSRGRTNMCLQMVTKATEKYYKWETLAWSIDPDEQMDLAGTEFLEMEIPMNPDLNPQFLDPLKQIYTRVLMIPTVHEFAFNPGITLLPNLFYGRFLPTAQQLNFVPIEDPPPYQNRHKSGDRTAAYLNTPFFKPGPARYKYEADPRYLSQHGKRVFTMVRKGLGLLATALQHFWNAGFIYAKWHVDAPTTPGTENTFYRLPSTYKNMAYASYLITKPDFTFGPNFAPLHSGELRSMSRAEITRIVKDYYYGLDIAASAPYYPLVALSVELLCIFNELMRRKSTAEKRAFAKTIMKHDDAFANTTNSFLINIGTALQAGNYVAIPVTFPAQVLAPAALPPPGPPPSQVAHP